MIEIHVPGDRDYLLEHLVLDVNGTLACDGILLSDVKENLERLKKNIAIHLVTADTHGMQAEIDARLGIKAHRITSSRQAWEKLEYIRGLGTQSVVAIGNGANDALMLREAALGILTIGREGAAVEALLGSRIVVANVNDALELLIFPRRLVATLRK